MGYCHSTNAMLHKIRRARSMKFIAYCPVDVEKIIVDIGIIEQFITKYDTGHHDGLWRCLPLLGRVNSQNDFRNAVAFEHAWEKRYNSNGIVFINELVLPHLQPLIDAIYNLPITPTHAQILNQTADVGKHYDLKHTGNTYYDDYPGINDDLEPASYKIMLNTWDEQSFYVAKGFGLPNHYIKLPNDTNTFVINEKTYPHGSTKPSTSKYIVSIFGLIDKQRHVELLERSRLKYSKFIISF